MSERLEKLLDRRVLIVTGKGGTGKTSVAAALARLAASRGIDVVLVETAEGGGLAELAGAEPAMLAVEDGREPVQLDSHLFFLRIRPEVALREYLELQLHMRTVVGIVMRNPGFRGLLGAAPGWRELITLGKLWHLESQREAGRPRWGLLVVDAPAMGHGLSFLSIPQVVVGIVRLGRLRRHTEAVRELLTDPARTLVVPVTLAEELPVRETVQLDARMKELGLARGPLIANAIEPAPPLPDAAGVLAALDALPPAPRRAPLYEAGALRASVEHGLRRAALQRRFLAQLDDELGGPLVELPYLLGGVEGPTAVTELADHLDRALRSGGGAGRSGGGAGRPGGGAGS